MRNDKEVVVEQFTFSVRCERCNSSVDSSTALEVNKEFFCNKSCLALVGHGNIVTSRWCGKRDRGNSISYAGGSSRGAE